MTKIIDCSVKLQLIDDINFSPIANDNNQAIKEIIDFAINKDGTEKYEINYGENLSYSEIYLNGKLTKRILKSNNKITDKINSNDFGIYFILSEKNELLYVGKSLAIKKRLKEHLLACSSSTNSHICDVYEYLLKKKQCNKKLCIKYAFIKTSDKSYNATIEGCIIDYILNHKNEEKFKQSWNIRED